MKLFERVVISTIGMILLSIGIGIIVNSCFGSDCLTLIMEAGQNTFGLSVGTFNTIYGAIMLIVSFFCDKKKIGYATVFYVVAGQYIIDATIKYLPIATNIYMQLLYTALAIVVVSLSSALCISSRLGLSFYDGFLFSVTDRFNWSFVTFRYIVEAIFLVVSMMLHTYPGIGTLIYFITLGPGVNVSLKLIKKPIRMHLGMPYED